MERIVLEVDDIVGKIYQGFTKEAKQQINQTVSLMVKKATNDATIASYAVLLDDMGAEALKNGLTSELLENLLAGNV